MLITQPAIDTIAITRTFDAVDLVCCQLVGVKPGAIPHLGLALEQLGLLCYEACPEYAISVKGYSGTRGIS